MLTGAAAESERDGRLYKKALASFCDFSDLSEKLLSVVKDLASARSLRMQDRYALNQAYALALRLKKSALAQQLKARIDALEPEDVVAHSSEPSLRSDSELNGK